MGGESRMTIKGMGKNVFYCYLIKPYTTISSLILKHKNKKNKIKISKNFGVMVFFFWLENLFVTKFSECFCRFRRVQKCRRAIQSVVLTPISISQRMPKSQLKIYLRIFKTNNLYYYFFLMILSE